MSSKSKARLPSEPLISMRMAFLRPVAKRVASKTPTAPPSNRARNTAASSTVTRPVGPPFAEEPPRRAPESAEAQRTLVDERLEQPGDVGDPVAGDVLGEVDDVGADVAEGAGPCLVLLEPPRHRRGGVGDPVLEVLRAHVPHLADPALLDQLLGQRDRRDAAVGEADHRPHAVRGRTVGGGGHRLRLGDRVGERLLAEHVLAGLERGDGDLRVGVAGRADVDQVDVVAGDQTGVQSVSVVSQPSRAAASATRPGSRPQRARMRGDSGRSKKRGAVRQACEWAAPMKA